MSWGKKWIWGLLAAALMVVILAAASADVPIDDAHFPDSNFKYFVLNTFDYNYDGTLNDSEINGIKYMNVSGTYITDLTGIKYFTALEYLQAGSLGAENVDLGGMAQLKTVNAANSYFSKLNLNGCTGLMYLDCSNTRLESLDLSSCAKLIRLSCSGNYSMKTLDVSMCKDLEELNCSLVELKTLNLTNNPKLIYLNCDTCGIGKLDLSKNMALEYAYLTNNNLTSLDLSNHTQLKSLYASGNKDILSINVKNCENLLSLSINSSLLETLDVSGCKAIQQLQISGNMIKTVKASGCASLVSVYASNNAITTLDLSDSKDLKLLDVTQNKLTSLKLNKNAPMSILRCRDNHLKSLDVSTYSELTVLYADINDLTELDVSNCPRMVNAIKKGKEVVNYVSQGKRTRTFSLPNGDLISFDADVTVKLDDGNLPPLLTKLTISPDKANLTVGDKLKLTVVTTPKGATGEYTWKSYNKKIATVSKDGTVKALSIGTVQIAAVYKDVNGNDLEALCEITVDGEFTTSYGTYRISEDKKTATFIKSAKKAAEITIPDLLKAYGKEYKVNEIAGRAFYNDTVLTSIRLGKNVLRIGDNAFAKAKNLEKVIFGKNIQTIGRKAFFDCKKLTAVTIGAKVSYLGSEAFRNCSALKKIRMDSTKLAKEKWDGSDQFKSINRNAVFKCISKKYEEIYRKLIINFGGAPTTVTFTH